MAVPRIGLAAFIFFAALASAQPLAPVDNEARNDFKKGVEAFQKKQFETAARRLTAVPELGGFLSLYKHWYLGQSLVELGKYQEAEPEFLKVMGSDASSEMKYQAQFLLGETYLRQKKYREAVASLAPLEKKWRRSYRLPEVLYRLLVADLRTERVASACARARRLYSNHPAHALVIGWGPDIAAVKIDEKQLPCTVGFDDFAARVKSLQWSGESDKAHKEITVMMEKQPQGKKFEIDMILAGYLVNDGSTDDALNLLIRYYPQQKSNVGYLMLLGKAAARSGEYQTAVGAYERAAALSSKSKKGREALYQAAYLSYQFQDYDGAVRKFQQFSKANPRSGLARDAQWHLAWLQYLRGDYKGALAKFDQVRRGYKGRRKQSDSLQERLYYWTAMAHIRLKQYEQARMAFDAIVAKNPYSYYGLAAQARLAAIKPQLEETKRLPAGSKAVPMEGAIPPSVPEEKESEEDIAENEASEEGAPVAQQEESESDEKFEASSFKDPAMRARIDVAQSLIDLGLPGLARWELWEVERHTRNPQYLRMLMSAYEGIGSYNRSASISELNFGRERERDGIEGGKALWQAMFPMAYKPLVEKSASKATVPSEWVWAIMRAESLYKSDVISPVGAKGLMQLMPYTANNLTRLNGEDNVDSNALLQADTNIRLGAQYLGRLQAKFKGQLPLVAAAYNAGPHRVDSWLVNFGHLEMDEFVEHIPFLETRNYVKKVVRNNTFYRRLYAKDVKPVDYLAKGLGVPIPSRAPTRENWDSL
ncbi:MAG TPA: transglycosylase SLT domain-containing protein [Bdellovibrionales bacterium]|nr:transglycosylase SLT domain-containing protein [Bdellovibrionales bacterium]